MTWDQLSAWSTGQLSTIADYNADIFAPNAWTFGMAFAVVVVLLKFWREVVDRRWQWVILVYDLLRVTALGLSVAFSFSIVLQVAGVVDELDARATKREALTEATIVKLVQQYDARIEELAAQVKRNAEDRADANASRAAVEALVDHVCGQEDIDPARVSDLLTKAGFSADIFVPALTRQIVEIRYRLCSD